MQKLHIYALSYTWTKEKQVIFVTIFSLLQISNRRGNQLSGFSRNKKGCHRHPFLNWIGGS